jgi:hypothetical protein
MAAKQDNPKTLQIGDVATFVVAIPHCGLEKGYRKKMKATHYLLESIEKGYWKVVKR